MSWPPTYQSKLLIILISSNGPKQLAVVISECMHEYGSACVISNCV